jgi:asparagine synthase (glutamine-hydrolysing)
MCGFLGEISPELLTENSFKELLDLSLKRGPDQQGYWRNTICQLGFNRLAILDVSEAGKQPMVSPSGRYVMVLNGEIYNFKSLQLKYHIANSDLRSASDTEVLCHLLDKISITELVTQLNGMFAIGVWDIELEQLTLIRDFSGMKPLYYGVQSGTIVFASQFDQVFKHPLFLKKTLRPDAMKSYFGLGYMHDPDTVFENIYQVSPGQLLVWDFKKDTIVTKENYYNWEVSPELLDTVSDTKNAFKKCMESVIKRQLQSDVPIGTFLSSGIDSSLITAFAKREAPSIKAFTFGIDNHGKYDERADASTYASVLKVNHITDTAKESELLSIIDSHFSDMPEPFGDFSSIPTYVISQKARQYATVMLSGDGGDELFWGYPRFRASVNNAYWFKYPLWFRKVVLPFKRRLSKNKISWGLQIHKNLSSWILSKQIHFRGIDEFMPKAKLTESIHKTYKYEGSHEKEDVLQYLKKNEFYGHMQRVLKKVDLTSMAHSLEVRVPFLDKEMISFSNRVKSGFTIHHHETKLLLKNSLFDFIPKDLVNKEKIGFTVPLNSWLRDELKSDFIGTLLERPFYGAEFVNLEYLRSLVYAFFESESAGDISALWHVYAWQKWAIHHDLI